MTEPLLPSRPGLAAAAQLLLHAHTSDHPLLLVNIWDVASARAVEEAGFAAIGTSSRAIAAVLGEADDDSTDPDVVFGWVGRITRAVSRPVTVDLEAGLGLTPTELVRRLLAIGAVGCNLEDSDHHGAGVLVDVQSQSTYISQVRQAADAAGVHLVINARVDTFIRHFGDEQQQFDEAVRRGRIYLQAGADCVFPIALGNPDLIAQVVAAIPGPVNIMARRGGPSIQELTSAGVCRISLGSGLHRLVTERLHGLLTNLADRKDLDVL